MTDSSARARALPNVAGAALRTEHVYPLNLLAQELVDAEPALEPVARIVADRLVVAVITAEEDQQITDSGLSRSMPAGWDGRDPFDRYRAAGLEVASFAPRGSDVPPQEASSSD